MKKITLAIAMFSATLGSAQNTTLFEISGNGSAHKSYLFGTIHSYDEEVFGFNDSVFYAIDATQKAVFELDMEKGFSRSALRPSKDVLDEWENYFKEEIAPEIEKRIEADTLSARLLGLMENVYDVILKLEKNRVVKATFIDKYFQDYARVKEKEIVGIETASEQIDAFLKTDKKKVKKAILKFIDEDKWDMDLSLLLAGEQVLLDAYANRDLDKMCTIIDDEVSGASSEMVKDFYNHLFHDRNVIMGDRTLPMLKEGPVFIAVGAGHLCGKSGLVEQYRKAGYTVRPMDIVSKQNSAITWNRYEGEQFSIEIPEGSTVVLDNDEDNYGRSGIQGDWYTGEGMISFQIYAMEDLAEEAEEMEYEGHMNYMEEAEAVEYYEEEYDGKYEEAEEYLEYSDDAMEEAADEGEYDYDHEVEEAYEMTEDDYDTMETEAMTEEEYEELEGEENYMMDDDESTYDMVEDDQMVDDFDAEPGYWDKVESNLKAGMMQMVSRNLDASRDIFGGVLLYGDSDSIVVNIGGNDEVVPIETGYFGNTAAAKYTVQTEAYDFVIKINGDKGVLKSDEVKRFFESFEIED